MTALVGLMLGIALTEIAQKEHRKNIYMVGGSTLGFVLGFAFQGVKQQKDEQPDYQEQNNPTGNKPEI